MRKWCKIIEVLDTQVLFYTEPHSDPYEKDEPAETLHQIVRINDVCSDYQIRRIPVSVIETVFDTIGTKDAERVVKTAEDLLEKSK